MAKREKEGLVEVECLACGSRRSVIGLTHRELGECRSCGYVGWDFPSRLDRLDRRSLHTALREARTAVRPPEVAMTRVVHGAPPVRRRGRQSALGLSNA